MLTALLAGTVASTSALAQDSYDASWYDAGAPYAKIAVTEDGVHRVTARDLRSAGVPVREIDASTLRLLEKGDEVPLHVQRDAGALSGVVFAGRRNRGGDEVWAYNGNASYQSSAYNSLFTDTLTYWLTWGGADGRRYQPGQVNAGGAAVATVRDTAHRESDRPFAYHRGPSSASGGPLYARGEGYYMTTLDTGEDREYAFALPRAVETASESFRLSARMVGRSGACHRAQMDVDFGEGFETIGEVEWREYRLATVEGRVSQGRLQRDEPLRVRVRGLSGTSSTCNSNASTRFSIDYVEVGYTRRLAPASDQQQRFTLPAEARSYELSGYDGSTRVEVLNPSTGRRFTTRTGSNGTARLGLGGSSASTTYWATPLGQYRRPGRVTYQPAGSAPDWTAAGNDAAYVILTTELLRGAAEDLAAYRASQNGYSTAVVTVREVFDQFDYGRATPIAIRRFVHRTQSTWSEPARFLTLWGDALGNTRRDGRSAPWNVPTFGVAPSDTWYAMQYAGRDDWSEVVALGRVPLRTPEQGETFIEKLQTYEAAPVDDWQKRYLALSGGVGPGEQNTLSGYNTQWAEVAAAPPTGMDTLYYGKQSEDALTTEFQDSLDAAFDRGAGWLNYFGHSAASGWEIVTENPINFDNAGKLPFVVSLGCQTGAFARGTTPSYGEQLVLGMNPEAPFGPGSGNGAIAHFGTSYLGSISTSARLNDFLISQVYEDTTRQMGRAVQRAKNNAFERFGAGRVSTRERDHLLQYNLLGDPAARLAIPDQPNLHVEASQIRAHPLRPVPSDSLRVDVTLRAQGLVPGRPGDGNPYRSGLEQVLADTSVALTLTQQLPGGEAVQRARTIKAFAVDTTLTFDFFLEERAVGDNVLRLTADYVNHPLASRPEAREDDNVAETIKSVFSSGVRLLSPRAHGTVKARDPVFRVALSTDEAAARTVRVQLAADSSFADVRAEATLDADGPLAKWTPSGTRLRAGQTYYWRARTDGSENEAWRRASFTAEPDGLAAGWLQQGEQLAATGEATVRRRDDGWAFDTFEIEVETVSQRAGASTTGPYGFVFNGGASNYIYNGFGIGVLVMDGKTGEVKASTSICPTDVPDSRVAPSGYDGCKGAEQEAAIDRLEDVVENTLDDGDYLFTRVRNIILPSGEEYPERVRRLLRCLGTEPCPSASSGSAPYSAAADTLTYGDLWLMKARKGYPEATYERADPRRSNRELAYTTRLSFLRSTGQATTARIGPSQAWNRLTWRAASEEDSDRLRLEVLSGDGETVLREVAVPLSSSPSGSRLDLSDIEARAHPYLRLRATFTDTTNRTPARLERWHVAYTPTAELAIDRARLRVTPADSLQEGQAARVQVPLVNIGAQASAPIRASVTVTDSSNQASTLIADTLDVLASEEEHILETALPPTESLAGLNTITARARQYWPEAPQTAVPEPLPANNSAVRSVFVASDRTAPALRVSVDGRTLRDTPDRPQQRHVPFVSYDPTFEITLSDDSPYLALDDTSLVEVRFGAANSFDLPRVYMSNENLRFVEGEAGGKPARVLFSPDLRSSARDTVYTLSVEVADAKGNEPEDPYQVFVRVKDDLTVEDMYPYPNPMSRRTKFMFELQGSDMSKLRACRMRIYTLSGQLVRDVDLMQPRRDVNSGDGLRAGWNWMRWDGTDQDGDRLATGVYLYKVHMEGEGDLNVNDGKVEKVAIVR